MKIGGLVLIGGAGFAMFREKFSQALESALLWVVVGLLDSAGTTFDSEIWARHQIVAPLFRKDHYSSIVLRTADAVTPFLTASAALTSLILFVAVYAFIFSFGTYYIYRLLRAGPAGLGGKPLHVPVPNRPMSLADKMPAIAEAGE